MRQETINIYKFAELDDESKQRAVERLSDINVDYCWWESTYEDASNIGLTITGFDIDRGSYLEGDFKYDAVGTAEMILREHGESCDTYLEAFAFLSLDEEAQEDEGEQEEFFRQIRNCYLEILRREFDYLTSEAAIIETIKYNEYEFDARGLLY